jgi:hypothetical protein
MKIIFNSDVLHNFALARPVGDVPKWLRKFCQEAAELGSSIVIPETTLLELERIQKDDVRKAAEELKKAHNELIRWGVGFADIDITEVVKERDLIYELRQCGAEIIVEPATLEDFRDAHRRACLHLPPHPPSQDNSDKRKENSEKDSDEMRDLVIWAMALRFARTEGKALLISKDQIHIGQSGDQEANAANLFRQKGSNQALVFLGVETKAERMIKELLAPAWPLLKEEGLPIGDTDLPYRVEAWSFIQDNQGLAKVKGLLRVQLSAGKRLTADLVIDFSGNSTETVTLSNIQSDEGHCPDTLTVTFQTHSVKRHPDYPERYAALKTNLY